MKNRKKAGFSSYIAAPLSIITGFTVASLIFTFILKNPSPVPVFIIFGFIQSFFMILFAILPPKGKKIARGFAAFLIGSFIFVLAGVLGRTNFQLEGLFFYAFSGSISGVIVHFMMAKVIGPIFFGRNWCSWGCWTSMILDLLPFKTDTERRKGIAPKLRYFHFAGSLLITAAIYWGLKQTIIHTDSEALKSGVGTFTEMIWFIAGNAMYYFIGITMALTMKDNRAFCKYVCPVSVFYKTINRFTFLRIKGKKETCTNCNSCVSKCPMNINIPHYVNAGERVKSTECIMCLNCVAACPEAALKTSIGYDIATKEHLS